MFNIIAYCRCGKARIEQSNSCRHWGLASGLLPFAVAFIIAVFFISPKTFAAVSAVDELGGLLKKIRTMECLIEQTLENQKGKTISEKTIGTMMLERPGKFRWETTTPIHQLIIVNKNTSIVYDVDLEQAIKRKVNINQPGNPAMLLSGSIASLKKAFNVKKIKKNFFELSPKGRGNSYQKIFIQFAGSKPSGMIIIDNLDQKSTITFSNIKLNTKIPKEKFIFKPPAKVEVLEAN